MAHQSNIAVGGHTVPVWKFDSTAQQIDNVVAVLGAASTPQAALAALGAGVRPNLLDNAYFVGGGTGWGVFPVNQKGVLSGSVDRVFICDRWNQFGSEWELTPDGVVMAKRSDADYWSFFQVIQTSMLSALVGEKLTASVLFDNSFVTSTQVLTDNVTAFLFANGERIEVYANNGGVQYYGGNVTRTVKAIKLEVGEGQTLAYQKSDGTLAMLPQGLDYQVELAKCQTYLKPLAGFYCGGTAAVSTTRVLFFVPGLMRSIPAVSGVSNLDDAYIAGAEIPGGILYLGNGTFSVIQRGNGYVVLIDQSGSIGTLKTGRVVFDVGWLNAEL